MKTKIILIAITGLIIYSCSQKPTYQYQFQNPALSFEERVDNIVSLLTVEERVPANSPESWRNEDGVVQPMQQRFNGNRQQWNPTSNARQC